MLEFICQTCGKRVQGDDYIAGKCVMCPACNVAMTAPQATPTSVTPTSVTPTTAMATPEHAALAKVTTHSTPSDGAFSDGLPPLEPRLPSLREATPHVMGRMVPFLVAGIIAVILAGLLIPAVQKVREASARTQSTNNLKNIGLAAHTFHDGNKRLPFNGTVPARSDDPTSGSWAFQIMPGIDQSDMFHRLPQDVGVTCFMCPGRGRAAISTTGAWTDYFINPYLNDPDGVTNAPDCKRSLQNIPDGASNTIFAGHGGIDPDKYSSTVAFAQSTDIFRGGNPATARCSTTNQLDRRGDASLTWGGPFPQGALMVWCDGTVRLMPYTIPGGTIRYGVADGRLGEFLTPAGGECDVIPD